MYTQSLSPWRQFAYKSRAFTVHVVQKCKSGEEGHFAAKPLESKNGVNSHKAYGTNLLFV